MKQLGSRPYDSSIVFDIDMRDGTAIAGNAMALRDRKGGESAEWPEDLRVREFPAVHAGATGLCNVFAI